MTDETTTRAPDESAAAQQAEAPTAVQQPADEVVAPQAPGEPAAEELVVGEQAVAEAAAPPPSNKRWFVVHTYSGFENKVAASIEQRAKIFGLEHQIGRVVVPTEKVVEVRNKQKRETEQKFFPGYVLVEMELTDESWHLVRSTPKVTGFVGSGAKPVPLSPEEVQEILRQMEVGAEKPKPKSIFQRGDKIRVIEGPFINFTGTIEDLNLERGKLKVMVAIFGRLTPVELEYYQVERL